jgi:hypothetical protein
VGIIEQREQRWLVQDRTPHRLGVVQHRREREDPTAAGAEHHCGGETESVEQCRCVVGLLLRRGRIPTRRAGATAVPPPVIGHDRALLGQDVGESVEHAAASAGTHDQQQRYPGTPQLVGELGAISPDHRHDGPSSLERDSNDLNDILSRCRV